MQGVGRAFQPPFFSLNIHDRQAQLNNAFCIEVFRRKVQPRLYAQLSSMGSARIRSTIRPHTSSLVLQLNPHYSDFNQTAGAAQLES